MYQYLIVGQILWSIFVFYLAQKRFGSKFQYLVNPDVLNNQKYESFIRTDYKNWNKLEFILVGIFLVPFRLFLMLGYLVLGIASAKVLFWINNVQDYTQQSKPTYRYIRLIVSIWAKLWMWRFGIQYQQQYIDIDISKYPKVQKANVKSMKETIVVCNHVCFFDFFPFFAYFDACTIAKDMVKNIPFIGFGAKMAQVIFVERFKDSSKKEAMVKLRQRIELNKQGITPSQILIFPESTVTNGKYLLQFYKGAFVCKLPITVCAVQYESLFHPSMNLLSFLDNIIGLLFQLRMKMKLTIINGAFEPKQDTSVEEFTEEIRTMMAQENGMKKSHNRFPDNKDFEKLYMKQSNQIFVTSQKNQHIN